LSLPIRIQRKLLKNFIKVRDLMIDNDIIYWLDCGTILCAYRDGDLRYEHDIDVGIFVEDFHKLEPIKDDLNKFLDNSVGIWKFHETNPIYFSYGVNSKTIPHTDIIPWYPIEEYRSCWNTFLPVHIPKEFLKSFSYINFKNLNKDEYFLVPTRTLEYIEYLWGKNWKTPINSIENHNRTIAVANKKMEPYPSNQPIKKILKFRHNIQHFKLKIPKFRPKVTIIEKN